MDERDTAALLTICQESARYLDIDVDLVKIVPKGIRKFCIAVPSPKNNNESAHQANFAKHITEFVQAVVPDAERMYFAGLCSLEKDAAQIAFLRHCLSKKNKKKSNNECDRV